MYEIKERRKHARIEEPYTARFRVKPNDDKVTKDWDAGAVFNLSASGIYIYSRIDLEVDTILDLNIGVSSSYPDIRCVGKVIRVTKHPVTFINGYAVEFTEIDEQIKKMINKNLKITKIQKNYNFSILISSLIFFLFLISIFTSFSPLSVFTM